MFAMAQEGAAVKIVDGIQQRFADVMPEAGREVDAGFLYPAAFPPCLLAFLRSEGRQIVFEIGEALVRPMELAVTTQQPAGLLERLAIRLIEEQRVRRGELACG